MGTAVSFSLLNITFFTLFLPYLSPCWQCAFSAPLPPPPPSPSSTQGRILKLVGCRDNDDKLGHPVTLISVSTVMIAGQALVFLPFALQNCNPDTSICLVVGERLLNRLSTRDFHRMGGALTWQQRIDPVRQQPHPYQLHT